MTRTAMMGRTIATTRSKLVSIKNPSADYSRRGTTSISNPRKLPLIYTLLQFRCISEFELEMSGFETQKVLSTLDWLVKTIKVIECWPYFWISLSKLPIVGSEFCKKKGFKSWYPWSFTRAYQNVISNFYFLITFETTWNSLILKFCYFFLKKWNAKLVF